MCAHFPVALDQVWYLNSFISHDTANDTPLWRAGVSAPVILTGNYQHTAVPEFCSFFFLFMSSGFACYKRGFKIPICSKFG